MGGCSTAHVVMVAFIYSHLQYFYGKVWVACTSYAYGTKLAIKLADCVNVTPSPSQR